MTLFNPADIVVSAAPGGLAVAAAEDDAVLSAAAQAYQYKLAVPILCGDGKKIKMTAGARGIDISPFEIIHCASANESIAAAISLVRQKRAAVLMKGHVQTADLLRAVLDRGSGLRQGGMLSHVSVLDSPVMGRRFVITDAAMVAYPDLKAKVELIQNAVRVAAALGIQNPRVAALAAVEVVNPDMQATLDAAALTVMNRRGQISGCTVDGPLAMDLALSREAARHKGVDSDVAGRADILLMPNIEAANIAVKAFTHGGNCLPGGVVIGAAAPVVLNSRSDSDLSKLFSIFCAVAVSHLARE
ncbi:MAG: bifunctional enoyl-CoA hydratase/phosphate acetyltransferase [Christensenellales bacterium]|jgi:phosphate butyryltransferase